LEQKGSWLSRCGSENRCSKNSQKSSKRENHTTITRYTGAASNGGWKILDTPDETIGQKVPYSRERKDDLHRTRYGRTLDDTSSSNKPSGKNMANQLELGLAIWGRTILQGDSNDMPSTEAMEKGNLGELLLGSF